MKMRIVIHVFAISMCLSLFAPYTYAEEPTFIEIHNEIKKRDELGVITSSANVVKDLIKTSEPSENFGTYLTAAEEYHLKNRINQQDEMLVEIDNLLNSNLDFYNNYQGSYIDQDTNTIKIALENTDKSTVSLSKKRSFNKDDTKIEYISVKYSEEELETLYNKLVDIRLDVLKKHNIDIQFLLSDFINQKIEVGVNNDDLDSVLELLVEETKSDANMLSTTIFNGDLIGNETVVS